VGGDAGFLAGETDDCGNSWDVPDIGELDCPSEFIDCSRSIVVIFQYRTTHL
jgi:hypothetical protein